MDGIKYPFKFRLTETKDEGRLDVVVTRDTNPFARSHNTPLGTVAFVSGTARVDGSLKWGDKSYDPGGKCIGSCFMIVYEE